MFSWWLSSSSLSALRLALAKRRTVVHYEILLLIQRCASGQCSTSYTKRSWCVLHTNGQQLWDVDGKLSSWEVSPWHQWGQRSPVKYHNSADSAHSGNLNSLPGSRCARTHGESASFFSFRAAHSEWLLLLSLYISCRSSVSLEVCKLYLQIVFMETGCFFFFLISKVVYLFFLH